MQQLSHLGLGGPFPLEDADLPVNDSKCLGFQTTHYRHDYGATKALRRSYYCQARLTPATDFLADPFFSTVSKAEQLCPHRSLLTQARLYWSQRLTRSALLEVNYSSQWLSHGLGC